MTANGDTTPPTLGDLAQQIDQVGALVVATMKEVRAVADRGDARDSEIKDLRTEVKAIAVRVGAVEGDPTTRKLASIVIEGLEADTRAKRSSLHDLENERRAVAQYKSERRALFVTWAKRAGLVVGPMIGILLGRALGIIP